MLTLTRIQHKAQVKRDVRVGGYTMFSDDDLLKGIECRLTGSQWRLWTYLSYLDPFADETRDGEKIYHTLPSPIEIARQIGSHHKTVMKDLHRLQELGLYDFRVTGLEGYNSTAKRAKAEAQRLKNQKDTGKSSKPFQEAERYLAPSGVKQRQPELNSSSLELNSSSDTYIDHARVHISSDLSNLLSLNMESEREIFEKDAGTGNKHGTGTNQNPPPSLPEKPKPFLKSADPNLDQSSAAPPRPVENFSSQITEWLNNQIFMQWWANRLDKAYGTQNQWKPAIARVRGMIRDDPQEASDMFAGFQAEMGNRVENYNQRLLGGCSVSDFEEIAAIAPYSPVVMQVSVPALAAVVTDQMPVTVASVAASVEQPAVTVASVAASVEQPVVTVEQILPPLFRTRPIDAPSENGAAYENFVADPLFEAAPPPQSFKDLVATLAKKRTMPKNSARHRQPGDRLAQLRQMMTEPGVVRQIAIKELMQMPDIHLLQNENGEYHDFEIWGDF